MKAYSRAKTKKVLFLLHIFVLFTLFALPAVVAANEASLSTPYISGVDATGDFTFKITANGLGDDGANAVLVAYDSEGVCTSRVVEPIKTAIMANIPFSGKELSYKLMLMADNLRPLCPPIEGKVVPSAGTNVLELNSEEVCSIADNELEYYVNYSESNKTKIAKLDDCAKYYYNGKSCARSDFIDYGVYCDGSLIKLKDLDSDSLYDAAEVECYSYGKIKKAEGSSLTISFGYEDVLTLDAAEAVPTLIFEELDGTPLDHTDLSKGDVVALMSDSEALEEAESYIKVIRINSSCVKGVVDETYSAHDNYYAIINGNEYPVSTSEAICTGDAGTFYIGISGHIVYADFDDTTNYGYIVEGAVDQGVFNADKWQLRILTEEDGVVTFDVKNDYRDEVAAYIAENFTLEEGADHFYWDDADNKQSAYRLVRYEVNSAGEIKELEPARGTVKSLSGDVYNEGTQTISGTYIEDDVIVFDVSKNEVKEFYAGDLSSLIDGAFYSGLLFVCENERDCVMVVSDYSRSFSSSDGFAVATKVVAALDDEEEMIYKIHYVKDGAEGTLILNDDSCALGKYDINRGDAFVFLADSKSVIEKFCVIAQVEDNSFVLTGAQYQELFEDVQIVSGYISNTMRRKVAKGELITINDAEYLLNADTAAYLYENSRTSDSAIATDDLFSYDVDYFDSDSNAASFVLAWVYDGAITDVYALNQRLNVTDMSPIQRIYTPSPKTAATVTINARDITNRDFDGRVYEYYTDEIERTPENIDTLTLNETIMICIDIAYFSEKSAMSPALLLEYTQNGEIKFADTDSDGYYDKVHVQNYTYDRVESVDTERGILSLKNIGRRIEFDFADEDATILFVDDEGNEITLADFEVGDIVAVSSDATNPARYYQYIKVVKHSDSSLSGTVTETYTDGSDCCVVIGENTYIDYFGLDAGDCGIFYIAGGNVIIDFESPNNDNYAYVLEGAVASKTFSADKWQLKLLTKENGIVTYDIADNYHDSVADYIENYFTPHGENRFLWDEATDKAASYRLVEYKLNSAGEIKELKKADGYTREIETGIDEYRLSTNSIGGMTLEDDVIVFDVCSSDMDDMRVTDKSRLVDEGGYSGIVFRNEDGEYQVIVITDEERMFPEEDGIAIATGISCVLNNDGENVYKISYVQKGINGEIFIDDDSCAQGSIDDIALGDAFVFIADSDSVVKDYCVVATVSGNEYKLTEEWIANIFPDTEIVAGYISNTRRQSVSGGEAIDISDASYILSGNENAYLFENSRRYDSVIVTDELFCENVDYFDEDTYAATFVLATARDGEVVDICALNQRVDVESDRPIQKTLRTSARAEKSVTMHSSDLANTVSDGRVFEYYTDAPLYTLGSIKNLTVNESVTLKINNKTVLSESKITPAGLMEEIGDGFLEFTDSDSDGYYDIIHSTEYIADTVEYVRISQDRMQLCGGSTIEFAFDSTDVTTILEDDCGNSLYLDEFAENDIVMISCDSTDPEYYSNYIRVIKITKILEQALVSATYSRCGESYAVIDGKAYVDRIGLKPGAGASFYIGPDNSLLGAKDMGKDYNYGYILEGAISEGTFSSDKWQLKLLTEEAEIVAYDISAEAHYGISEYIKDNFLSDEYDEAFLWENAYDVERNSASRLVEYKLNSKGEITELQQAEGTVKAFDVQDGEYNADTQSLCGVHPEDDAIVFVVTDYDVQKTYASDIDYFTDRHKYAGFALKDSLGKYAVMVITEMKVAFFGEEGIAIVTKVSTGKNSDGKAVTIVTYVRNETEGVVMIDDDTEIEGYSDYLSVGDAFVFVADDSGTVTHYMVLVKNNSYGNFEYDSDEDDIEARFFDDTDLVLGYIENERRVSYSAGECITVNGEEYLIRSSANKYTLNTLGRNITIEVSDFMYDADYFETEYDAWGEPTGKGYACPVFLMIEGGEVVDVYTSNARFEVEIE